MVAAYFSPRAIKANEDAVRKQFTSRANDTPLDSCKSRVGARLGPAYIRAALDEINRGTPAELYQPAFLSLLGWMLANTVAAEPDLEERMRHLGRAVALMESEALAFAMGNAIVEPDAESYGEPVGGHA